MGDLDVLLVCGDGPLEVLGRDAREQVRLTVDGAPAAIPFLVRYFQAGRNAAAAMASLATAPPSFLSLNGPYLLQYLRARGFRAEVVEAADPEDPHFVAMVSRQPTLVAISTTFMPFAAQIDAVASRVRKVCPNACIVAGGIQVWKSFRHRELLDSGSLTADIRDAVAEHSYLLDLDRESELDYLVVNERGEHTLARVLQALRDGGDPAKVPSVSAKVDGRWVLPAVEPEPYTEVSVDWSDYLPEPTAAYVPIQAGLGCAFDCSFCDFRGLRSVQLRSTDSLVSEIRSIPPKDGLRRVYFTDDNLFASRSRAREICRALIDAHLGVCWRGMIRISSVDTEIAALMKESGCAEVLLGVESGDNDMLRRMNKNITAERVLAGVEALSAAGINTKSTFIVGFPGETANTISNTVDLLNAYPTAGTAGHRYLLFTYAVLPLSSAAEQTFRDEHGLRGYGYHWQHNTMDATTAAAEMRDMHDRITEDLSPNYVLEVPEDPFLVQGSLPGLYRCRNKLARAQRGLSMEADSHVLWDKLESCFRLR